MPQKHALLKSLENSPRANKEPVTWATLAIFTYFNSYCYHLPTVHVLNKLH